MFYDMNIKNFSHVVFCIKIGSEFYGMKLESCVKSQLKNKFAVISQNFVAQWIL